METSDIIGLAVTVIAGLGLRETMCVFRHTTGLTSA